MDGKEFNNEGYHRKIREYAQDCYTARDASIMRQFEYSNCAVYKNQIFCKGCCSDAEYQQCLDDMMDPMILHKRVKRSTALKELCKESIDNLIFLIKELDFSTLDELAAKKFPPLLEGLYELDKELNAINIPSLFDQYSIEEITICVQKGKDEYNILKTYVKEEL